MHPEISQLPSHLFYQGRLLDGPDMDIKTKQPWQSHPKFGCYRFFNVSGGQEEGTIGHSMKNVTEAQVAVALYARLCKEFVAVDFDFRVGIVSMYRGQVLELQRAFARRFSEDMRGKIHFHTVDGFQGQEKDIIILSCVRAGPGVQSVGFLAGMVDGLRNEGATNVLSTRCSSHERSSYSSKILLVHLGKCSDAREE